MRLSYGNGEYNGNIKSISWQIDPGNSPLQQKYSFSYDGLSRLLSADYEEQYQFPGSPHNPGQFDVDLSYDLNGNIETLERNARGSATNSPTNPWETAYTSFTLDNLTYDYTGGGNQLQKVSDAATTNQTDAYAQFLDGSNSGDDYDYDANGNLTQDLNKGISSISYNHLNKPTVITYSNGNIIRYYYSADGMKLRQTVYSADQSDPPVFAIRKRTDYLGVIHYEDADGDGTTEELEILFAQHEEGRYRPNGSDMIYEYNLTDHLGNTRITFGDSDTDGDADILQESHYYPFGMLMTMTSSPSAAPPNDYLYNGKELQTELGLDWYDYGARMYDASIGRWNSVDPKSQLRNWVSAYNYVQNNPVNSIDPTGELDAPVYSLDGNFLGTDDQGLQGEAIFMDAGNFKQGMSHEEALNHNLGYEWLTGEEAEERYQDHFSDLPDRPDYDGHLTHADALDWSNGGSGDPLFVDARKIDLSPITVEDVKNAQENTWGYIDFFDDWSGDWNVGRVYGNIKVNLIDENTGEVRLGLPNTQLDIYDFKNPVFSTINDVLRPGDPAEFIIFCAPCNTFVPTND